MLSPPEDVIASWLLFGSEPRIENFLELGSYLGGGVGIFNQALAETGHTNVKFTVNALNINDSVLEYFNYTLTPEVKVIDAVRASCSLPFIFPSYEINGKYYYDGGICNNCPIDIVDEIDSIAFDVSFFSETINTKIKLLDLLNCLVTITNKKKMYDNVYTILDESFKDEVVNFNQSRDDIFNIYMIGYTNSKNIIFKNHIALK
jgi:predicted acylesterase/phospholipase RssA